MRRSLFFVVSLVLASNALAATGGGTTGTQGLKLPRVARAVGLGNAYVAVASGADSILWNPAGLNQLRDFQASAGHLSYLDGISDDYLLLARPIYGLGAWGLGLNYLYASDQGYDNWGNATEAFNVFDFSGQVAMAVELAEDLNVGGVYKILRQGYGQQFSMGSGVDFGLQYRNLWKRLDLGAGMYNAGTPIALGTNYGLLPLAFKAGGALHLTQNWLVAADFDHQPVDHFNKWHFGSELRVPAGSASIAGRAGYTLGPEQDQGGLAGLAVGLGLGLGSWQVDYSYTPQGDLGNSHRISLTWSSWLN